MTKKAFLSSSLSIFLVTFALAQDVESPEAKLGAALHQQEVEGDFEGAITAYEEILELPGVPREIAARSLLQLGIASEALGLARAVDAYERLIREFGDQTDVAAEARARLDLRAEAISSETNPARRLVVDWPDFRARTDYTAWSRRPTRDGRHVVGYNAEERAFEEIEISTGSVRRLTSDGPDPSEMSAEDVEISTNGHQLAAKFRVPEPQLATGELPEGERFELRVFDVGGQGPGRVLVSWDALAQGEREVYLIDWSPQDDRIWLWIVQSDRSVQIASVDMNGGLRVLKTLPWEGSTGFGALSPDGRFLAYHDAPERDGPADVFILATDGSGEERIRHPAADRKPIFLPDGSGIVFESDRRGYRDLWFQAITDGRPTGEPRLVWHNVGKLGTMDRFTESGSLAYFFRTFDPGVYISPMDLVGTETGGEPTRLDAVVGEPNSAPAFSPDGKYLAHFRANASAIVLRDLATGSEREIGLGAPLGSYGARTSWCPSGNALLASGYIQDTGPVTYRVDARDGSYVRLPIEAISWPSPVCVGDGEEIIYVPAGDWSESMLVRRNLGSGRETTLFEGRVGALAQSLDGNRLAVVTMDADESTARLFTMAAAGGEVSADLMTTGTVGLGGTTYPGMQNIAWMPGGDRLLVIAQPEALSSAGTRIVVTLPVAASSAGTQASPHLWEVPVTGAAARSLGPLRKPAGLLGSFTVHPDGSRFAFMMMNEGRVEQTWAIDNLLLFIKEGGGWQ